MSTKGKAAAMKSNSSAAITNSTKQENGNGESSAGSNDKNRERLEKLKQLRQRYAKIEEANRQDMLAEHQRHAITPREEMRAQRKLNEAEELLEKQETEERGEDYDRKVNLQYTAEDVEKWERKQKQKEKRKDTGFGNWEEANLRKHKKLVNELQPDLEAYELEKLRQSAVADGDGIYRDANSVDFINDAKPPKAAVDRMVDDLQKQMEKRKKHSRHRAYNPDEDIHYINDKNMRFNKKISRAYDEYTKEIRDNLERGTAL